MSRLRSRPAISRILPRCWCRNWCGAGATRTATQKERCAKNCSARAARGCQRRIRPCSIGLTPEQKPPSKTRADGAGFRMATCAPPGLLQPVGDLVERGLDAGLILFAARSTGGSGPANHFLAEHDRQRALHGNDVAEIDETERGFSLDALDHLARWRAGRARSVGLPHAVFHGVRIGIVAADLQDDLAVSPDYRHRYAVAVGFAGGLRGFGNGHGDRGGYILVLEQLGVGGRNQHACAEGAERNGGKTERWPDHETFLRMTRPLSRRRGRRICFSGPPVPDKDMRWLRE